MGSWLLQTFGGLAVKVIMGYLDQSQADAEVKQKFLDFVESSPWRQKVAVQLRGDWVTIKAQLDQAKGEVKL